MSVSTDLRLYLLLLLNAATLFAAWHAARRLTRDPVQRAVDALLAWYLVQYAAVTLPGVAHVLSLASISLVAFGAAALTFFASRKRPALTPDLPSRDAWIYVAAAAFVITFHVQVIRVQNWTPLTDSDAITYHAPAAVQWLQTGRLGLLPTWFFNPANTFSPLGGSAYIAWALAPLNGDALARFVQAPAIFLLFLAVLQLARALGANPLAAALLAVAAAVGRLCTSEVANPRDDIFLTAFVLVAFAAFSADRLGEKAAPWRVGVALGLALATKYTALISLPLLLLMLDAPIKARWSRRQWLIALGCPLLIAGPWYLRNALLTGNPLYPLEVRVAGVTLFKGLFVTERSLRLRTLAGIRDVFIEGYHGLPVLAAWTLGLGWIAAIACSLRRLREPMVRACVFGPIACAILFLVKSPYGEVRFLYPAIFVAVGSLALIGYCSLAPGTPGERVGVSGRRDPKTESGSPGRLAKEEPLTLTLSPEYRGEGTGQKVLTGVALYVSFAWLRTSYRNTTLLAEAVIPATLAIPLVLGLLWIDRRLNHSRRARAYAAAVALLIVAGLIYTLWTPYVDTEEYHAPELWRAPQYYPRLAAGWTFVRESVPPDATIAYTQTYNIYPLYGPRLHRRLVYVPVRPDVADILHLPHFPKPLPGEPINATFTALLNDVGDKSTWLTRLKASGANYLFICLGTVADPPEERWARATPGFSPVFTDENVKIYRLTP